MRAFRAKFLAACVFGLFITVLPRKTSAQDDARYRKQVYTSLSQGALLKYALNHNFQLLEGGYRYGYINVREGSYQTAQFHLETGYIYEFIGACDDDCTDMDFALVDDDSQKIVAEDTKPDDTPLIVISPSRSGSFTLVSKIPKCGGIIGCYWAVQAVWK